MDKFEFFKTGSVQSSYGGQYSYKVIGPCCRLYDREELPWPCSRLAWRSKEPSWRRIGSRFVADMASRKCPSYSVQILEPGSKPVETVITLFSKKFSYEYSLIHFIVSFFTSKSHISTQSMLKMYLIGINYQQFFF